MRLRLGTLELQSRFLLAPLERVSDMGFRHLCYQNGAGITWTEMVRALSVARKNASTLDLIDTHDPATLTGVQLFAVNERELDTALEALEELAGSTHPHFKNIRAIDLNFGCPSPDIIRIGAGPAMVKRQAKMRALFETLRAWKERTTLPIGAIGAKIRLGLNEQEFEYGVYLRIVEAASELLDYLTVHARHARMRSSDPARWDAIRQVKAAATIPIIGNGDALTAQDAHRMLQETGCDGVLIARGAIRDPWIFRELLGGDPPSDEEIAIAQDAYMSMAHAHGTKPKYVAFHAENFAHMLEHAQGHIPKTEHL
jgi:tRNA-dihydrouridine synthase